MRSIIVLITILCFCGNVFAANFNCLRPPLEGTQKTEETLSIWARLKRAGRAFWAAEAENKDDEWWRRIGKPMTKREFLTSIGIKGPPTVAAVALDITNLTPQETEQLGVTPAQCITILGQVDNYQHITSICQRNDGVSSHDIGVLRELSKQRGKVLSIIKKVGEKNILSREFRSSERALIEMLRTSGSGEKAWKRNFRFLVKIALDEPIDHYYSAERTFRIIKNAGEYKPDLLLEEALKTVKGYSWTDYRYGEHYASHIVREYIMSEARETASSFAPRLRELGINGDLDREAELYSQALAAVLDGRPVAVRFTPADAGRYSPGSEASIKTVQQYFQDWIKERRQKAWEEAKEDVREKLRKDGISRVDRILFQGQISEDIPVPEAAAIYEEESRKIALFREQLRKEWEIILEKRPDLKEDADFFLDDEIDEGMNAFLDEPGFESAEYFSTLRGQYLPYDEKRVDWIERMARIPNEKALQAPNPVMSLAARLVDNAEKGPVRLWVYIENRDSDRFEGKVDESLEMAQDGYYEPIEDRDRILAGLQLSLRPNILEVMWQKLGAYRTGTNYLIKDERTALDEVGWVPSGASSYYYCIDIPQGISRAEMMRFLTSTDWWQAPQDARGVVRIDFQAASSKLTDPIFLQSSL